MVCGHSTGGVGCYVGTCNFVGGWDAVSTCGCLHLTMYVCRWTWVMRLPLVGLCVCKWMLVCVRACMCVYAHLYVTSRVCMGRTGPGLVTMYIHGSG